MGSSTYDNISCDITFSPLSLPATPMTCQHAIEPMLSLLQGYYTILYVSVGTTRHSSASGLARVALRSQENGCIIYDMGRHFTFYGDRRQKVICLRAHTIHQVR